MTFDLCENALTLTPDERAFVNGRVGELIGAVQAAASRSPVPMNVYLGGSLARREPAVRFAGNQPVGMMSDADFFVLVKDMADLPKATFLDAAVADTAPGIDRSFHYGPAFAFAPELMARRASAGNALLSVWFGMGAPVVHQFPFELGPPPPVRPFDYYQLTVQRAVACACKVHVTTHLNTGGIAAVDEAAHKLDFLRLALACLEVQFGGKDPLVSGITGIRRMIEAGRLEHVTDARSAMAVLTARERFDPDRPLPALDYPAMYGRALAGHVGLPPDTPMPAVIEALGERYAGIEKDFFGLVTAVAAGTMFILRPGAAERQALERALSRVPQSALDTASLAELSERLTALRAAPDDREALTAFLLPAHQTVLRQYTQSIQKPPA